MQHPHFSLSERHQYLGHGKKYVGLVKNIEILELAKKQNIFRGPVKVHCLSPSPFNTLASGYQCLCIFIHNLFALS